MTVSHGSRVQPAASQAPSPDAATERRRAREKSIIRATRELFDQRGVRDAHIRDICRAVGINRAIVYRHFTGKEEIFALVLVTYLDELQGLLAEAAASATDPRDRIVALVDAFVDYGVAHPAFVDCAQALMRHTGSELLAEISHGSMYRLGQAMSASLAVVSGVIEDGQARGAFEVEDAHLTTNLLYATGLGALDLARLGMLVRESSPGVPQVGSLTADHVRAHLVRSALAAVQLQLVQ